MSTTKMRKRFDHKEPRQQSFYDLLSGRYVHCDEDSGQADVYSDLKRAMKAAIKNSDLSIYQFAGELSHVCDAEISVAQINSWIAPSKDRHIPAQYLAGFCLVAKDSGPLEVLASSIGLVLLKGADVLNSEIHHLREDIRQKKREIRMREKLLELYDTNLQHKGNKNAKR